MALSLRRLLFKASSIPAFASVLLLLPSSASASRSSRIDEAGISEKGKIIIEYGQDSFEETSTLQVGRDVASYFNLGYALTKRSELRLKLLRNDLSGGNISFNPIFSDLTSANGWGIEFKILLDETKAVLPTKDAPQFQPGSAFSVGLGANTLSLESPALDTDMNSFYGYVLYSTDFSPELRGHTLFALSHFTSDFRRGNTTTIGLGADYDLVSLGKKGKLQLSANGLMDIVSIRKPTFDTGRVTRFDASLRMTFNELLSGYAGWAVANDSFTDTNSQGLFYGVTLTPTMSPLPEEAKVPEEEEKVEEAPQKQQAGEESTAPQVPEQTPPTSPSPQEETKGASMVRDKPPVEVNMQGADEANVLFSPGYGEGASDSGGYPTDLTVKSPWLTTSERIVRPPPIENPWELLPLGYDFHPLTFDIKELESSSNTLVPEVDSIPRNTQEPELDLKDKEDSSTDEKKESYKIYSYF